MHIHTVKENESIASIAEFYGVSAESIMRNNELPSDTLIPGEELVILIPTRTYTPKRSDTLNALSLRFGTNESELCSLNPGLSASTPLPQKSIALKFGERPYGMAASNGYFYNGCDMGLLRTRVPYLTYLTFAAAKMNQNGISYIFDVKGGLSFAKENNVIPILKIFDDHRGGLFGTETDRSGLIDSLILFAKAEGFKGIVLSFVGMEEREEAACEFLVELRGKMIGCDLILITELDERSPKAFTDYSDGTVLSYIRSSGELNKTFKECEWEIYSKFACDSESSKTFIDLPSFAHVASSFSPIGEVVNIARRNNLKIQSDDSTLYSVFNDIHKGRCTFPSIKNVKATLDLIHEYGFMGISFDIMRTPLSYLTMYNALFKTAVARYHSDFGGM